MSAAFLADGSSKFMAPPSGGGGATDLYPSTGASMANFARATSGLVFTDPNGLSSSVSLTDGLAELVMIPSAGAQTDPGDAAGWSYELQIDGAAVTSDRVTGFLRIRLEDLTDFMGDPDGHCFVALLDSADRTTANGFGVSIGEFPSGGALRIGLALWECTAGVWASTIPRSTDALDTLSIGEISWCWLGLEPSPENAVRRIGTSWYDTTGAITEDGTLTDINLSMDFAGGAWVHFGAWRGAGDGIAPNDTSLTAKLRPLGNFVSQPDVLAVGVVPS